MCGRYSLEAEIDQWSELGVSYPLEELFRWRARYNIAPSQRAPVILNLGQPKIALASFGFVPPGRAGASGVQRIINARAEGLSKRPLFREAFRCRRCIVLASGFFEWRREGRRKVPHYIQPSKPALLGFAGLWQQPSSAQGLFERGFALITTRSNALVASIHDRMPAILHAGDFERWLCPDPEHASELAPLLRPYPPDRLQASEVSALVNSPHNDQPECIAPVAPAQTLLFPEDKG